MRRRFGYGVEPGATDECSLDIELAVRDQLGFRIDDLPLSPPRVLEAIDEEGGGE